MEIYRSLPQLLWPGSALGESMSGHVRPRQGTEICNSEKRAQRLSFWVRRPPGGVGVFHAKGWWPKTSCPPSKLCLPWVSKRGIRDVPEILPGCPGPLAVFKNFVQKNFVRIFRSINLQFRGAVSTGGSPLDFLCFFSSFHVQFSKTSPLKSGESSEKSSGENRVKSCHVCGCHSLFGPDNVR